MSLLSDKDIYRALCDGDIGIDPWRVDQLQPASYDVAIGSQFRVFHSSRQSHIDPKKKQDDLTELVTVTKRPFVLHPGEFVLGVTVEHVMLSAAIAGKIEGKSSLGRLGLVIHATAGWLDPGFTGNITLELGNQARLPILIYPGMLIGQVAFMVMSSPAERPYGSPGLGSKYQGDTGPSASRSGQ